MTAPIPPFSQPIAPKATAEDVVRLLMREDFKVFMSCVMGEDGLPLAVDEHHQRWCDLITELRRLVLLAPRDHSKSTTVLVYILWQFFRHATDPLTGQPRATPAGTFSVLLMSATRPQSGVLMERLRNLLACNPWIDAMPAGDRRRSSAVRSSDTHVRLGSGAELRIRPFRSATRGLHPDMLILDDVLTDENCGSELQRQRNWNYFIQTLLPMHPARFIVVGTAMHQTDLLHRLKPARGKPIHGFAWRKFRAINEEKATALWPERHPYAELIQIRDDEPAMFSREYMNDPRDDMASYFPRELTQAAIDAGASNTLLPMYQKQAHEFVVLGVDIGISGRAGADYSVAIVMVLDRYTRQRRVIATRRFKGLDLQQQIELYVDLAIRYGVDVGFIEDNVTQAWLVKELQKREGGHVFYGHTTDRTRSRFDADGIPILAYALLHGRWIVPSGDEASREFARIWQAELGAFGWRNGRIEGVGEHDDTVIASWLAELAARRIDRFLDESHEPELYFMEDLFPDWEPVKIGPEY